MDKIIIKGMDIFAYHGVLDEEKKLGQHFIFDIKMYYNLKKAGGTDNLKHSVSYADVYIKLNKFITENSFDLIEKVAEESAKLILENFDIKKVKIKVKKPQAPIAGHFDYTAIEIIRKK